MRENKNRLYLYKMGKLKEVHTYLVRFLHHDKEGIVLCCKKKKNMLL